VIEASAGDLPTIVDSAESALITAEAGIYQRGGQLVRIARLKDKTEANGVKRAAGSVIILPVTKEYLTLALARPVDWVKYDARSRGHRPIDPPPKVAASLLAMAGEWRFPVLTGVTAAPTLRADGSLLDAPGYDKASGLYGAFELEDFDLINPAPTREDALEALAVLDELFSECAFSGWDPAKHDSVRVAAEKSAHASVAIAATITASVRLALPTAPATGISAMKQGSGKTTIARAIAQIVTGREPPVLALSQDEAEFRKGLLGILIAGDTCVLVDNVAHPVDSAALCAVLTNATYTDRVMGGNGKVTVPTLASWLFTGNHLEFVGDLTTRALLSVLDPELEHPEAREFKRDLPAYVAEHRGKLLAAALTIPLAYLAAGAPPVTGTRSRFAAWDRLVRRPLLWLGCADPLETQAEVRAADPVREGLVAVLHTWADVFGEVPASVAQAVEAANRAAGSVHPQLLEALQAVAGEPRSGTVNTRRLGRYLVRNLRRIEDGRRFEECEPDLVTHRRRFKVSGVTGVSGVLPCRTREIANLSAGTKANADNAGNAAAHIGEGDQ